jgi:hypothetical protein
MIDEVSLNSMRDLKFPFKIKGKCCLINGLKVISVSELMLGKIRDKSI